MAERKGQQRPKDGNSSKPAAPMSLRVRDRMASLFSQFRRGERSNCPLRTFSITVARPR